MPDAQLRHVPNLVPGFCDRAEAYITMTILAYLPLTSVYLLQGPWAHAPYPEIHCNAIRKACQEKCDCKLDYFFATKLGSADSRISESLRLFAPSHGWRLRRRATAVAVGFVGPVVLLGARVAPSLWTALPCWPTRSLEYEVLKGIEVIRTR